MRSDSNDLNDTLRDVFSLAPSEESLLLYSEMIAQYEQDDDAISQRIIWAEFNPDMSFVRAGISNARTMETVSVLDPGDHPEIQEINDVASHQRLGVGMVIPAGTLDGFHWCVPFTTVSNAGSKRNTLRTVLITEVLFGEVFDLFNRHSQLTPSEKRMVFQVVAGLNPKSAAEHDGGAIETKRSHLKRAMSKLGCASQSEMVRMMVSQLIHIMYLCEQDPEQSRVIDAFTTQHLCEPIRLSTQRLPTGRLQRIWEMGPVDGKPLLVLHGYLFPFLLLNAQEALKRFNIRLVIPVRGGYLDNQANAPVYDDGALVEQTVTDILAFVRQTWAGPVDVLCHSTGAFFAMLMLQRDKDVFSQLVVTSINLMDEHRDATSPSATFLDGLRKLATHNGMYKKLSTQFQRRVFSNGASTRFVLRKLFSPCPSDVDVLNGKVGHGEAFDWYRALHAHSTIGIASDFGLVQKETKGLVSGLKTKTVFLHGSDDPFTSADNMQATVAGHRHATLRIIEGSGHLGVASHAPQFWDAIADVLQVKARST